MSDVRSIAAENLDLIGSYSPDIHARIERAASRNTTDFSQKGQRRAMIDLAVSMGLTTPMPAHGSQKSGKGYKLNHATQVYLNDVKTKLDQRNL